LKLKKNQIKMIKRLEKGSIIYHRRFLSDPYIVKQKNSLYDSTICFLRHSAYARQGAAPGYSTLAVLAIDEILPRNAMQIEKTMVKDAWTTYKKLGRKHFPDLKLNENNNPMYWKDGILALMEKHGISNLYRYVADLLKNNNVKEAHKLVKEVRGVGTKISALYLRDVAFLENIPEDGLEDDYLLQPIDTWIRQGYSLIMGESMAKGEIGSMKAIVEMCNVADVSPIKFNQGVWVVGSQIAKDFYYLKRIAEGDTTRIKITIQSAKKTAPSISDYLDSLAEL
jgi:hypothetical protein